MGMSDDDSTFTGSADKAASADLNREWSPLATTLADAERRLSLHSIPEPMSGCWLWTAYCTPKGYGRLQFMGCHAYAHRVTWMVHCGPIPDGLFVCHRCDNPYCVNPAHLFLGTNQDNVDDCAKKGRHKCGDRQWNAKIRAADVLTIRKLFRAGHTQAAIGRRFGVRRAAISKIVIGENWRKIPDTDDQRAPLQVSTPALDKAQAVKSVNTDRDEQQ